MEPADALLSGGVSRLWFSGLPFGDSSEENAKTSESSRKRRGKTPRGPFLMAGGLHLLVLIGGSEDRKGEEEEKKKSRSCSHLYLDLKQPDQRVTRRKSS